MNDLAEQLSAEFGLTIEQVMDMFGRIKRFANDSRNCFIKRNTLAVWFRIAKYDQLILRFQKLLHYLPPTVSLPHWEGPISLST
jgi:hypothetical protein